MLQHRNFLYLTVTQENNPCIIDRTFLSRNLANTDNVWFKLMSVKIKGCLKN